MHFDLVHLHVYDVLCVIPDCGTLSEHVRPIHVPEGQLCINILLRFLFIEYSVVYPPVMSRKVASKEQGN